MLDERAPPPTETIVKCSGCYFVDTTGTTLTCHRHPPMASSAGEANWPTVEPTDWCGHGYDITTHSWNTPAGTEPQS
jgi:hypothetical protein